MAFYYYFLNPGSIQDEPDKSMDAYNELTEEFPKSLLILDVGTLRNFIKESVEKYYNINDEDND